MNSTEAPPNTLDAALHSPALKRVRISSGSKGLILPESFEVLIKSWNDRLKLYPFVTFSESQQQFNLGVYRNDDRALKTAADLKKIEGIFENNKNKSPRYNERTQYELGLFVLILSTPSDQLSRRFRRPFVRLDEILSVNTTLHEISGQTPNDVKNHRVETVQAVFEQKKPAIADYLRSVNQPPLALAYIQGLLSDIAANDLPNLDINQCINPNSIDAKTFESVYVNYLFDRQGAEPIQTTLKKLIINMDPEYALNLDYISLIPEKDRKRILNYHLNPLHPHYANSLFSILRRNQTTYIEGTRRFSQSGKLSHLNTSLFEILLNSITYDVVGIRVLERIALEKIGQHIIKNHPGSKDATYNNLVGKKALRLFETQGNITERDQALTDLYQLPATRIISELLRQSRHTIPQASPYPNKYINPTGLGQEWGRAINKANMEIATIAHDTVGLNMNSLLKDIGFSETRTGLKFSLDQYREMQRSIFGGNQNLALGLKEILQNSLITLGE